MTKRPTVRTIALLCLASLCFTGVATAQEQGLIELRTTAQKQLVVVLPNGERQTQLVAPSKVVPGDRIAYTIEARNVSDQPAEKVVITDPIPTHMKLVADSVEGQDTRIIYSVDGGTRFDSPNRLQVQGEDGLARAATPDDYTHIRWVFQSPLEVETERAVRFVAVLN